MRFSKIDDVVFAIYGEDTHVKIDKQFFQNPEDFSKEILWRILTVHLNCEESFVLYYLGDNKYLLMSFLNSSNETLVMFSEMRSDGAGLKFIEPIPDIDSKSALPIITSVGSQNHIGVKIHKNDFNSLTGMILDIIRDSIENSDHMALGV